MTDIDIRLSALGQLYDSLDPAPFREKSLDRDAEAYLLECAGEHPDGAPLRLVVHGPDHLRERLPEIADAVHSHFHLLAMQADRRWRRHMRLARAVLLAGLVVLALSLIVRQLLSEISFPGAEVISEGLLILGWVALWRPMEQTLFDRFEHRRSRGLLERLSRIPVDLHVSNR